MTRPLWWTALCLIGCGADRGLSVDPDAATCASCHPTHYAEWSASSHARSASSPVFQALLPRVEAAWGRTARDRCVSCHAPGHATATDPNVTCVSCHAAVGHAGARDGRLHIDLDAPLMGPKGGVDAGVHRSRRSGLLRSPELCGTCHEVTGPELFVEPTLSEYLASGVTMSCVDCHMPRHKNQTSHRFVGLDPPWGAPEAAHAPAADEARALLAAALAIRGRRDDDRCTIEVTNIGAGHDVPTGATFLRAIWLETTLETPSGITRTGHTDASGRRMGPAPLLDLGAELLKDGIPVALPTEADTGVHRGLAPGESRAITVPCPPDSRLTARLRARAISRAVLEALELESEGHHVPTLTVGEWRSE